jgi:hypothetical protein
MKVAYARITSTGDRDVLQSMSEERRSGKKFGSVKYKV